MKADLDFRAREMLKAAKLYCTDCRVAILKILMKARRPLTQEQIARRLGGMRLDKVTIYRTLGSLFKAGVVHRAFIDERAQHFELADHCSERQCHPHFTCTSCGVTFCLTGLFLPLVKGLRKGFIVRRQQVKIEGLCSSCS